MDLNSLASVRNNLGAKDAFWLGLVLGDLLIFRDPVHHVQLDSKPAERTGFSDVNPL